MSWKFEYLFTEPEWTHDSRTEAINYILMRCTGEGVYVAEDRISKDKRAICYFDTGSLMYLYAHYYSSYDDYGRIYL